MPDTTIDPARIAQAIGDPGSIVPRVHSSFCGTADESVTAWATRAVLAVLGEAAPLGAGSPPQPEPTTAQVEIPANVYRAAETAYRHAVATGTPVAAHLVRIITPIVRQGAYADGWTDGRQLGIGYGRQVAADAIDAYARGDGYDPDPVWQAALTSAARIARGEPATKEPTDV